MSVNLNHVLSLKHCNIMIVRVKQILFIMFGRSVIFVFIHAYIKHDWVKIKQKGNVCVYLLHSVYDTNMMNNEVCVNQLL